MGRQPIIPSSAVAALLRERRRALDLSLRDVERQSSDFGKVIPFATLAKIERGAVDPGLSRLYALLRLYNISIGAAADLLELEASADAIPAETDPTKLRERMVTAWQKGRTADALGCLLALRRETARRPELAREHQESILTFAAFAGKLGRHHLARHMLDELLMNGPAPALLVAVLVQQSSTYRHLKATEVAFAYLERAAVHLRKGRHRERGWVAHQRASLLASIGDFDGALKNLDLAVRAFQSARRPFDQGMALAARSRILLDRGDVPQGLKAARVATRFAIRHDFPKIRMLATIQHARAHLLAQSPEPALILLRALLNDAIASSDNAARFYAHFHLWKVYSALGARAHADVERDEAVRYLRFVDDVREEAAELGGVAGAGMSQSTPG